MENKKPINPIAFPLEYEEYNSVGILCKRQEFGMTLRDYFAAKVLQGISSLDDKGTFNNIEEALEGQAKYCYKAADAMLKQRDL